MKPVSKTAFYCCGVRALDAASARPICNDGYAGRFMTPEAWAVFEPFRGLDGPNASNVVRHRMIDDLLRARLARRPDTGIVIMGAGFDTRAFRLPGGRWVELDEPAVIAAKDIEIPAAQAPNPLTRVAIAFDGQPVAPALAPFRDLPEPVVVLEGVLPYLADAEASELLCALRRTFDSPTLVCDLTTRAFSRRFSGEIGDKLRALGAPFGLQPASGSSHASRSWRAPRRSERCAFHAGSWPRCCGPCATGTPSPRSFPLQPRPPPIPGEPAGCGGWAIEVICRRPRHSTGRRRPARSPGRTRAYGSLGCRRVRE